MSPKVDSDYFKSLPGPYAIVGMGISGKATLVLLKTLGVKESEIFCFDEKDPFAPFRTVESLLSRKPKTLFVSPGVPLSLPWIREAKNQGVKISSELSLAFSFLSLEKVIGITGSVGKSTTTSLLAVAAQAMSPKSFAGGNLGTPLAEYISGLILGKRDRAEWVILELSSFQLENFENLVCEYSAVTYLTPNHLERYPSLEAYYNEKLTLIQKTIRSCVLNAQGGDLRDHIQKKSWKAALTWVDHNSKILNEKRLLPCALIGKYNLDNLAVAAKIGELCGWNDKAFHAMREFSGLPHRLENIGSKNNVRLINDSKATTIESVLQATETVLQTMTEKSKLHLLLGGHDKNLPWEKLSVLKRHSNLHFIFFGEFGESAKRMANLEGPYFKSLALCVAALKKIVTPGDSVLLSPGGTSHDEFKNFEERGAFFKSEVLRRL